MDFSVKFKNHLIPVTLSLDKPLAALKDHLAKVTNVPVARQKVFGGGVVMKEDAAPLRRYGVRPRAQLLMIESEGPTQAPQRPASVPPDGLKPPKAGHDGRASPDKDGRSRSHSPGNAGGNASVALSPEHDVIYQIDTVLSQVKDVSVPLLDRYSELAKMHAQNPGAPPPADLKLPPNKTMKAFLNDEYRRVSEVLMKQLLAIDNFVLDESFAEARAHRRQAVKTIQSFLDRADQIKSAL